ncbi:MAG: Reversal of tor2 lethality [Candelina mexicana]|nr:MAG: Reversal of tor2 lethality [Candelina mexicana]
MLLSLPSLLCVAVVFVSTSLAQGDPKLTGTWSSKSNKVFTGPGFYDPVNEKLFEPSHTGISYSFTDDGYYEVSYYRAIANPTQPQCPQGIMQWQHGKMQIASNGSLTLTPFGVDGRQLQSKPCSYSNSILTRFNQTEVFQRYEAYVDPYHNIQRLNLFRFDGSPLNPMYLAYKPPQMLPTQTLNPTSTGTAAPKATTGSKVRRGLSDENALPLNRNVVKKRSEPYNADKLWWIGAGMTALGGVGYLCF